MNKEQIQTVFERCGLGKMGQDLSFKLWMKGLGEKCDEEMLEDFLSTYDFMDEHSLLADDFMFHFQIFRQVIVKQDIPYHYLY
jgi:hypothetical protein